MIESPVGVSKKVVAVCALLTLLLNVAVADYCTANFTYNSSYGLCTHAIVGTPPSTTDYCEQVNAGSEVQMIDGEEMCTMTADWVNGASGGGGFGGGLPPPGRR